jgi:hypothetical protein
MLTSFNSFVSSRMFWIGCLQQGYLKIAIRVCLALVVVSRVIALLLRAQEVTAQNRRDLPLEDFAYPRG